jgi:3-oxoacyl-[acyl-carrier protein] reductase
MDMSEHTDRPVVLVTGASRGIGAAIADRLIADGWYVVGTATSAEAAAALDQRLGEHGEGLSLDVSDPAAVESVVAGLLSRHGHIDGLVNNAGITRDQLLMRLSEADWQAVLNTNLSGIYRTCRALLRPMLKARSGRIVNLASVIGLTGNAGQANYAAAKAGIIGFSKSLAQEVGSRGITVNVVAPGFIETDMTRDLPEASRAALLQRIALGRMGQPADIAAAVSFLLSPSATYITGETLHVNGGMYMA